MNGSCQKEVLGNESVTFNDLGLATIRDTMNHWLFIIYASIELEAFKDASVHPVDHFDRAVATHCQR